MPIFEYQCNECGEGWEIIKPPLPTNCPECGGVDIQKQVSLPGFRTDHTWDDKLITR